jgi:alkylhydroperoxidase family enzyme
LSDVRQRLARLQPDSLEELERLREAACQAVDPARLELSRRLLALRFGAPTEGAHPLDTKAAAVPDWATDPRFGAEDRAFLAFTEQFTTSVAHVSDEEVSALLDHASEQEVFDFAVALYILEMEMRMSLVANAVLGSAEGPR